MRCSVRALALLAMLTGCSTPATSHPFDLSVRYDATFTTAERSGSDTTLANSRA